MKQEDLLAMAREFKEVTKAIKEDDVTIEEMKEGLAEATEHMKTVLEQLECVLTGKEVFGMSEIERARMLENLENEARNYDKKIHKQDIKTVLNMIDALDKEIGAELFFPFIIETMVASAEVIENHSDEARKMAKTTRKAIKKYIKKRETNVNITTL